VHPGYDAGAVAARRRSIDLALVLLPGPLPLRFETAALSDARVAVGVPLTLGGYGVATLGDGRSAGTFRTAALAAIEPHGPSRILVWARGARGVGACHGDSGGPIARAGSSEVVALITWAAGMEGAGCGGTSQGVLVGPQRSWIDRTLAAWGRQARWR
jgi:trypsin